jgi:transposase InsO family protein
MRNVRTHQPRGQAWATDLAQPRRTDLGLRRACRSPICSFDRSQAFFLVELQSRKVIHVGVTRSPTDAWVAQQRRFATPYGQGPKYLIRDNDSKFGPGFARVAKTSTIKILKTPVHAPRANAVCERFLRSVRQECLDHLLILHERQLQRVLNAYVIYFNQARPHQGIGQQIPEQRRLGPSSQDAGNKVIALPVVGGLHHDYRWAA